MDIGVSLPLRNFTYHELREFAEAAEDGRFASINVGERIAFPYHDTLITLSFVAAHTSRAERAASEEHERHIDDRYQQFFAGVEAVFAPTWDPASLPPPLEREDVLARYD